MSEPENLDEVDMYLPHDAVPLLSVIVYALPGDSKVGATGSPCEPIARLDRDQALKVAPTIANALRGYADHVDSQVGLELAVDEVFTGKPS